MKTSCHHTIRGERINSRSSKQGWLLLVLFLFSFSALTAQEASTYAVHANIIYHFTKYINWPDNKKSGDFIIGVMGDSPLYDELQKNIANKTVGSQKIVIRKISSAKEALNCHILFISEDKSRSVKKMAEQTSGSSVLLVSEQDGLAQRGACINFIIVSDRLKLEINKNNIERRNLSIASQLLQLGKIVL